MSEQNTREKILLAAGQIFAREGFRGATVREICELAEVNVASVNYYFGDKQTLYNEAVMMAREMRVREFPYPTWDEIPDPEDKLKIFIQLILERLVALDTEPWQVQLLMREVLNPTDASKKLITDYFRPIIEVLLGIVDDLVGVVLPEHERNQIGFSIFGQCLHYRYTAEMTTLLLGRENVQAHFSRSQIADHITRFSLAALQTFKAQLGDENAETLAVLDK